MSVDILDITPIPPDTWYAVFTDNKKQPVFVQIIGWARVRYCECAGEGHGCQVELEPVIPNFASICTIYASDHGIRKFIKLCTKIEKNKTNWKPLCEAKLVEYLSFRQDESKVQN